MIDKETLGASDKALDYIVGITAKYILMPTGVSIAWFRRGNQDFPVLLMRLLYPCSVLLRVTNVPCRRLPAENVSNKVHL